MMVDEGFIWNWHSIIWTRLKLRIHAKYILLWVNTKVSFEELNYYRIMNYRHFCEINFSSELKTDYLYSCFSEHSKNKNFQNRKNDSRKKNTTNRECKRKFYQKESFLERITSVEFWNDLTLIIFRRPQIG